MRRREFFALATGAAVWPLAVAAQQLHKRKVGVFYGLAANDPDWNRRFAEFKRGLEDQGWSVTRDIEFEARAGIFGSYRPFNISLEIL